MIPKGASIQLLYLNVFLSEIGLNKVDNRLKVPTFFTLTDGFLAPPEHRKEDLFFLYEVREPSNSVLHLAPIICGARSLDE